mgnify:CR=1 FL=1
MRLALITAVAVMGLRVVLYYNGKAPEGIDFMLVHFLAISTVVFFACYKALRDDLSTGFPMLVQVGFKSAALYALLIGVLIWLYYTRIDLEEFPRKIQERVDAVVAAGGEEAGARQGLEKLFNPFGYASITFFALLAAGGCNALLIGLLGHKLLRRAMR